MSRSRSYWLKANLTEYQFNKVCEYCTSKTLEEHSDEAEKALLEAFKWNKTDEGYEYWEKVYRDMITGEDKTQKLIIIPKFVLDKLNAIAEKRSVTATKLINDVLYDFVNKK